MIEQIIDKLEIPGKLIYLSQYGSHLYGLNTENSDLDFRGVYIPNLDDIILHKDKDEINEELEIYLPPEPLQQKEYILGEIYMEPIVSEKGKQVNTNRDNLKKVDVKIFSLQKFIQLCSKADTNALDLLFSVNSDIPKWYQGVPSDFFETDVIIADLYRNRDKLINTDKLESPIIYAFKQATKYGIKGNRRAKLLYVLDRCKFLSDIHNVEDLIPFIKLDDKYLKIDTLDNKGTLEKYLNVCGVQHQFNLCIERFKQRIQDKIDKEYTSQRTIDACDGNDWKALSHALRVLFEIKELLETGNITFPCEQRTFLLDVKLGKVSRQDIDNLFENTFSHIVEKVKNKPLNWNYEEEFWDEFIVYSVRYIYTKV